jgi:beta-galactosidase/beta-glucuronidase
MQRIPDADPVSRADVKGCRFVKATQQDGSYPRPMMMREQWTSLVGTWAFAHDDADVGLAARWFEPAAGEPFSTRIEVPFPPESPASGIGARGFHPVVWYRRSLTQEDLALGADDGARVLVHFGAVDYRAQVWFDGQLVVSHVGCQTPFTADVTDAIDRGAAEHVLVVRAEDRPEDADQPRGKQDWRDQPHGIWYERTTGIWQTVWLETVPADHIVDVAWTADLAGGRVRGEVTLSRAPAVPLLLELTLRLGDEVLVGASCTVSGQVTDVEVAVPALRNGQDRARFLWTPETPTLVDISVEVREQESARAVDSVASYLGFRSASVGGGSFLLNEQPYYLRSVLNQGYRPDTHLANRGSSELRAEVQQIKAMGFNAVRIHQKAEDPAFLFWADRLGLLVWGETASAYAFSPKAVALLTSEWMELLRRDRSHPCVVTWVPINESWGVQDIAVSFAQQQFAQALTSLTRALDPSRPVLSNEGWEHVDSDILGLHDYTVDPDRLAARYATRDAAVDTVLAAHGPQGRRPVLSDHQRRAFLDGNAPLMITEFGGISMSSDEESWGYAQASSASSYATLLTHLFGALRASSHLAGFCYTQYMDTAQETNGLLFSDGTPKLPLEAIRQIVTGLKDSQGQAATSTVGWVD